MKKLNITEDMVRELLMLVGFLLFCAGIWLIYPPASLIIGGLLIMWVGLPTKSPVPKRQRGG